MLKEKTEEFNNGDVVGLKMKTGEELIGKVSSISDTEVTVHTPFQVVNTPQGLALIPLLFMGNTDITIPFSKDEIMVLFKPGDQFVDAYIQQTTDIVLPESSILTG